MNLIYSSNSACRVSLNIMRQQCFPIFLSYFLLNPPASGELLVLMSVLPLLSGAREAGPLLTIDWEILSVFLLAWGRLHGPHKCWWGWNSPTAWCLHCDLWNVPSKRVLGVCEFLRGLSVPCHYVKPAFIHWVHPAVLTLVVKYEKSYLEGVACTKEQVACIQSLSSLFSAGLKHPDCL